MTLKVNPYSKIGSILLLFSSILMIGYVIPRNNFSLEIGFFVLGITGLWLYNKQSQQNSSFYFGLLLRASLLIATPLLSDDYFRFLWDGYLTSQGINPFDFKPSELIKALPEDSFTSELYSKMNSPNYYSIYPPVNQWMFYIASLSKSVFGGIISLRLIILGFEVATYFMIEKIMIRYNISIKKLNFYWLNPIVILELTGNLHAEGVILFFLLAGLMSLSKLKDFKGGLLLALSFCSKLFSLMFLPLLLLKGGKYRWAKLLIGIIPLFLFSFIPFLDFKNLTHFFESLNLYFQSFEFNGSIFNLIRWVGLQIKGYDVIRFAGPILSLISGIIILLISWKYRFRNRKVIFTGLTLMISTYFLFSPIVHPWYVIIPLTLGLFTQLKFPLVWGITAFLSYSFYDNSIPHGIKNTMLLIEYLTVFAFLYLDIKKLKEG